MDNVDLDLIAQARLDKLLKDLVGMKPVNVEYSDLITQAMSLQLMWQKRFGTKFFSIDRQRFEAMFITGALRGLILKVDTQTRISKWQIKRGSPLADSELNLGQYVFHSLQITRTKSVTIAGGRTLSASIVMGSSKTLDK